MRTARGAGLLDVRERRDDAGARRLRLPDDRVEDFAELPVRLALLPVRLALLVRDAGGEDVRVAMVEE